MKMKKYAIPAGILVLACAAAALALFRGDAFSAREGRPVSEILTPFRTEDAVRIELSWRGAKATLEKKDGVWSVAERMNHPADAAKAEAFLEALRDLRPLRRAVPADRATCSGLRLNPEETDEKWIPGLRVTVRAADGSKLRDLTMGAGFYTENSASAGASPEQRVPDGRWFGKIAEDGTVEPFLASQIMEEYHPRPGAWMSAPVIDRAEMLIRIHFQSEKYGEWMIARLSPAEPFEGVIPEEKSAVPRQSAGLLLSALSHRFTFEGFREEEIDDLKPLAVMSVAEPGGLVRTLEFFSSEKAMDGVFCRPSAKVVPPAKPDPAAVRARADAFTRGREHWLYYIPGQLFEAIRTKPFGEVKK